jgi:hypothetical protein
MQRLLPMQEHFHLHFSAIIFLVLLAYIVICIVRYMVKDTTGIYEVVAGDSGEPPTYQALIIRDETIYNASYTGYVNYYSAQGERLRVDSTVCTLDEHGDFLTQLVTSSNSLSDSSMAKLKNALHTVSISYDPNNFDEIYTEKSTLNTTLLSLLTEESIASKVNASDEYTFNVTKTPVSGTFVSSYDGYEDFDPSDFKAEDIDPENYQLTTITSGQIVQAGDPLYKMIPTDQFTIIFQMSEEDQITYWENQTLTIRFPDIDKTITGTFSFIFDEEHNRYARVDFSDYGYMLANTRFSTIEICSDRIEGLKLPTSALVNKDFTLVPKTFRTRGGNNNQYGCLVQYYENGELKSKFVPISIIGEYDDEYYLVDSSTFEDGEILIMEDDPDTIYEIGAKKTLQGVYSVNKGYAVFKPVNILIELEDGYVIVEEGYYGSISQYDRIALNAALIQEGAIIY